MQGKNLSAGQRECSKRDKETKMPSNSACKYLHVGNERGVSWSGGDSSINTDPRKHFKSQCLRNRVLNLAPQPVLSHVMMDSLGGGRKFIPHEAVRQAMPDGRRVSAYLFLRE